MQKKSSIYAASRTQSLTTYLTTYGPGKLDFYWILEQFQHKMMGIWTENTRNDGLTRHVWDAIITNVLKKDAKNAKKDVSLKR